MFTHRLSRLLVHVRMGKSCIMLAPRNILKHMVTNSKILNIEAWVGWNKDTLKHTSIAFVSAGLTVNAGQTGSGKLKHPRMTGGCHKDVWADRGGGGVQRDLLCKNGTIFWTFNYWSLTLVSANTVCVLLREHTVNFTQYKFELLVC